MILRMVLAQLNPIVGDIEGNLKKHIEAATMARDQWAADVIIFPELSLSGYPPEDLLFRESFVHATQQALHDFTTCVHDIYCVIGHPHKHMQHLQNACSLVHNGKILGCYAKRHLPNDGVFDECRYFVSGTTPCLLPIKGLQVGLLICEDLWHPQPIRQTVAQGARLIIAINASPFEVDKHEQRLAILNEHTTQQGIPILYVNQVGGQDELIFDGGSMVINAKGHLCELAGFFHESLHLVDIDTHHRPARVIAARHTSHAPTHQTDQENEYNRLLPSPEKKIERIYRALVLSVHDYVNKNHFSRVLVGVSGGIDSALTLTIAVDALGKERVQAIMMPSCYTSKISTEDAVTITHHLGIMTHVIPIETAYHHFLALLTPTLADHPLSITEENIQARCRAIILMALSNQYGALVLNTGNRSELAVGYCTLYGDMAGGFAVLKDVSKTLVYELAAFRNQKQPTIPPRIIQRAPTAELAPNQQDTDALPPYPILDQILDRYLTQEKSIDAIVAQGFDPETVTKVISMVRYSEYKRRQIAIGPRINHKAFGKDRRYPITNGFKG